MNETVRVRITHALLSFLLALGLLIPLFQLLEPSFLSFSLLFPAILVIVLFEIAAVNRFTTVLSVGAGLLSLAVWLFAMNGMLTASDVVLAVYLRLSGIHTALPLVADAAVILTVLVTLVCCFSCLRGASVLPSAILCIGMILLIYLSGETVSVFGFLPALAAMLLILLSDRFPETPVLSLIPVTALLVVIAFLLAGNGVGPNPLRDKADELRQAVLDRLFFTEPRDVFSLSTEGYYPQGQSQLGGKPTPSNHVVMQVSTPRTVYLRGVVLNHYTGRSWINTTNSRRFLWQSSRFASHRSILFDEDLPSRAVRNALCDPVNISVRILNEETNASTLFVPQRLRSVSPGGDLVPYFSNSSELFATRNLKPGDTYSVSAPLFLAGDPGLGTLIEVCSTLDDDQYDSVLKTYTVLPNHLSEPVYELAREAASASGAPYDQALAIQSWLGRSFRYTLDVEDQPENYDFVTSFLLNTRKGYCTYFASAMTVLCRMIGLPARYVEGYLAEPDENGEAIVTGLSAHAWTEVYFKGFGWLTFDPTPRRVGSQDQGDSGNSSSSPPSSSPSPSPSPQPPEEGSTLPTPDPTPVPSDEPTPVPSGMPESQPSSPPDEQSESSGQPDSPGGFPWLLLLLILLLIAAVLRVLFTSPVSRERRAGTDAEKFEIWIQEISDLLYAENLTRRKGESPMAFGRRIDRTGLFSASLGPVGECVSLIRYSRTEVIESDLSMLRNTSELMKKELSRPARLRYLLRRVFVPLKKRRWA